MKIEYRKFHSSHLGRDMEFKIYGHGGKPMIVFPSSGGSFYEYEDFGMIEACRPFIDAGKITVFAPDSVDSESWLSTWRHPYDRAQRHIQYDKFIIEEFVPLIKYHCNWQGGMILTGCSMGGYHSTNFYFKHPDVFDTVVALSGIYDARFFVGDYMDYDVYMNSPVDYMKRMDDPWFLDHYRQGNIIICAGQGRWEEDTLKDTRNLEHTLNEKGISSWINYWGYDVDHDWPWWRVQMPYFLGKLEEQGVI